MQQINMPIFERPTITEALRYKAAEQIVETMMKDRSAGITEDIRDVCIKDIAECSDENEDGYYLAKRLDNERYWDCSLSDAEALDRFGSILHDLHRREELAWARDNNIQPSLANGTRIKLNGDKLGTIEKVNETGAASYLVQMDEWPDTGNSRRRRIVNFEDAIPLED